MHRRAAGLYGALLGEGEGATIPFFGSPRHQIDAIDVADPSVLLQPPLVLHDVRALSIARPSGGSRCSMCLSNLRPVGMLSYCVPEPGWSTGVRSIGRGSSQEAPTHDYTGGRED